MFTTYKPMIQSTVTGWMGDLVLVCSARLGRTYPTLDLPILGPEMSRGPLGLACVVAGWTADVPLRILPVGLPFPLAFHLELKGLRVSSAGQFRAREEGTRGSEIALGGAGR